MENGAFCSGCQEEADKNASGCPNCGTVEQRLACGLYEFKDPKGRSPVSYVKLLEKLNITIDNALASSGNEIDAAHFEEIIKVSKAHRGRPKKQSASIVAEHVSDLFTQLTPDAAEEEAIGEEVSTVSEKKSSKKVVSFLGKEEKEAKKAALEQEREAKKAEREMQRLAEKEAKRLEKEAKLAEEKAARELKLAEEKAAKELKLAEEKAAKELKRQQEKEEKEALKAAKASKPTSKKAKEVTAEPVVAAPAPAPAKVSVSRITIEGTEYLKSATNILYDTKTKEEVGLYDPISKKITALPEEDEEEVDSEYEEDEDA
jgi:hypothetical protein